MPKTLILCNCLSSQTLDGEAISELTGLPCSGIHTELCGAQSSAADAAIRAGDAIIACTQERDFFETLAEDAGVPSPDFLDIRNRAGWSDDTSSSLPKISALIAESLIEIPAAKSRTVVSEGVCLILAPKGQTSSAVQKIIHATARAVSEILNVTVLQAPSAEIPSDRSYDTVAGNLHSISGHFGAFDIKINALQEVAYGGRGAPKLRGSQGTAVSSCDLILDLSGGMPLFPAPEKRDGYLRAEIANPSALSNAILEASQLIGTFEKTIFLKFEESLCAHSRAEQAACSNCLDACPTGAISSAGDIVDIDPMICAGCGACASLCPSGAITYDAPPTQTAFARISKLAQTFLASGGVAPRLLVHDADLGSEMIELAARYGKGLPADVIPFETTALASFGHAEILAALSSGFVAVDILVAPTSDKETLSHELNLAKAIAPVDLQNTLRILDLSDPDELCSILYAPVSNPNKLSPTLPMGNRRQITRLAAKSMHAKDAVLPLPNNAPYGAVVVDTSACTLCLSCVSLCPSGALIDNPDLPQLRFQEDACLQCGLCHNICPEKAISLESRLNLSDDALSQRVLHEEEPCACIECGTLFGVKSTVDRIMEKLAGKHAMFATSEAAKMIQMCDDCRVKAQFHTKDSPFAGKDRPAPRTSDDYFSQRKDH